MNITINKTQGKRVKNAKTVEALAVVPYVSKSAPRPKQQKSVKKEMSLIKRSIGYMLNKNNPIDADIARSVHHLMQTLFFPTLGVYRGLAKGTASTSICTIKNSFDITIAANSTFSMAIIPTAIVSPGQTYYFTGGFNPYASGSTGVPGPFYATNPCTDGRVVSTTILLIPTASFSNASGEGLLAYTPSSLGTGTTNANFSRYNLDNLEWNMPFNGVEGMIAHWVPNEVEVDMIPQPTSGAAASSYSDPSSFLLYFVTPVTTGAGFRVEISQTIEYVPTVAYRPFVTRVPPSLHPSSYFYVNRVVSADWCPMVISDYKNYLRILDSVEGMTGGHTVVERLGHAGSLGLGGKNLAIEDDFRGQTGRDHEAVGVVEQGMHYIEDITGVSEGFQENLVSGLYSAGKAGLKYLAAGAANPITGSALMIGN